jgi:hypothetical protein
VEISGSCPTGSVSPGSQAEVEALRGCATISGDLVLNSSIPVVDEVGGVDRVRELALDLEPLSALRVVTGALRLSSISSLDDPFSERPGPGFSGLASLGGLQQVGSLSVARLDVEDLGWLGGVTVRDSLEIGGTSLRSLVGITLSSTLEGLWIRGDVAIEETSPLQGVQAVGHLHLEGRAVAELGGLESLTAVQFLTLTRTGLRSLDGLQRLEEVDTFELVDNSDLVEADALAGLTALRALVVQRNAALERMPSMPRVSNLHRLAVDSNPALREGPHFPGLSDTADGSIEIRDNALLLSVDGLGALREADTVRISRNAALRSVELPALLSISVLELTCNPQLPVDALVAIAAAAEPIIVDLSGNQGSAAACAL